MKRAALAAALFVTAPLVLGLAPPPPAPVMQACDVRLNVIDEDPAGLNVRRDASPTAGVLTALKPQGEWIQVHITGQMGPWYRVDRAIAVTDEEDSGERLLFEGVGWVHQSKVGGVELNPGATILSSVDGTVGRKLPVDEDRLPPFTIIGCFEQYLLIDIEGRAGLTSDYCANQRTTCV